MTPTNPTAAPQGIVVWKSGDLKGYAATLAPNVNEQKLATQSLANFGPTHNATMVYRAGDGEAEYHENAGDFTVVVAGACSLVLGGTVKDARTTGPGEIRGASIDGGQTYEMRPGDIINIPARTAHQVIVPAGGWIMYMVVKINVV
jgi:mannose-6-phosphate isomerase-like protein (cupin superfamily)